jgi:hypothetical protein
MSLPNTADFKALYDVVTRELLAFVDQSGWKADEQEWFRALIAAFDLKFAEWQSPPFDEIQKYLKRFDGAGRDMRLAGHVFLHIAFDLPRAIAETPPPASPETRRGQLFLAPSSLFPKIFINFARDGGLGILGRVFGRVHAMQILGFWVLALRAQCWVHAAVLAEDRARDDKDFGSDFATREASMARAMLTAADEAFKQRWVFGVSDLNNADLLPGLSPFMVAQVSTWTWSAAATTTAAAAIGLHLWWRGRRRRISAIEVLGAYVYREMQRALGGGRGEDRGPEPRRLAGARE